MWQDTRSLKQKILDLFSLGYSAPEIAEYKRLADRAAKEEILTGDPGSAPTRIAGLVLNPKNAKKIRDLFFAQSPNFGDNIDIAIKFIRAKYPKLSGLPLKILKEKTKDKLLRGEYNPYDKVVKIYNNFSSPVDAIDTVGHELTHSWRDRAGALLNKLENPEQYRDAVEQLRDKYKEESIAKRGGVTAKKAFHAYQDLIKYF